METISANLRTWAVVVGIAAVIVICGLVWYVCAPEQEKVLALGPTVNSSYHDGNPDISADGLSLFFTSDRPGGHGRRDIWVSTRATTNEPWSAPVNLGPTVNSSYLETNPDISADGLELFFHSGRPGGRGHWDLWMTTRATTNEPWGEPVNLGPTVNSSYREAAPNISADGLELYFVSGRPGGYGVNSLWVTTRKTTDDDWGEPVNLGPVVNSSAGEWAPSISADGLTLFFSSTRPGGSGKSDLWVTTRATKNDPWGEPVNLGPTVNSSAGDGGPSISSDRLTLFFASRRLGGLGDDDLWQVKHLKERKRPPTPTDSFAIPKIPEELQAKIAKARERVQRRKIGHVIVGRVVLDGQGNVRDVMAQMEILPEGYFAGPTKDLDRPVGFRMHQYAPYDLQLKGMVKDEKTHLVDVGTIHMKPLTKDELVDLKAQVKLEEGGDLSQARIRLSVRNGPVNTPSNGTEPRRYWPDPLEIPVQEDGLAQADGFSPIGYYCTITAPGYLKKSFTIEFKPGETLDLETITLEKPKQIELAYIVSNEPPFNMDNLKTVRIPSGTRWKAVDDVYGWDLEFKQEKGSVLMTYFYAPCYLWDLGDGEIDQYVNTDGSGLGEKLRRGHPAGNQHVYLLHQAHWKRWVLFKISIE